MLTASSVRPVRSSKFWTFARVNGLSPLLRPDQRDFPRAVGNRDLAFVLDEGERVRPAVERAGDDVHRAAGARRVGERVLELRPHALIEVGHLRHDVGEIERDRVVDVGRGAIRRAGHVAAIEAAVGVVRRENLLIRWQERVGR